MNGHIPQTFIYDLLNRVNIVNIVNSRLQLKKIGKNYSTCCPFHKEKTPSFTVSPDKQFYYCFGCGASGNAISFIMDFDQLNFPAAINTLANLISIEVPKKKISRRKFGPDYMNLYELMQQAASYYAAQLKKSQEALQAINYLKKRGLDGKICKRFGIGFAPPGWDNLKKILANNQEKAVQLVRTGMLVDKKETKNCYDRFRDRIMFPINDKHGRIIAFGGRVLGNTKPKYLNSPESPIFHKRLELYGLYEAKKYNRNLNQIIVVEGYMDVVALAQLDISHAVATLGTAITIDHMHKLFSIVSKIVFCFDGDEAGRQAAWRALKSILPNMKDGKQVGFLFLPQGEDPDSMVRREGKKAFLKRIHKQALSLDTFLFKELAIGLNLKTMDGRARLTQLSKHYIGKIPESIFKQLILQKLAQITGLNLAVLKNHMNKTAKSTKRILESTDENHSQYNEIKYYRKPTNYQQSTLYNDQFENFFSQYGKKQFYHKTYNKNKKKIIQFSTPLKVGPSVYAIRQLIYNPKLAIKVKEIEQLKKDDTLDTYLLVELLKKFKQKPGLSTVELIMQWQGTKKGNRLQQVATLALGNQPNEQEFWEAIKRIRDRENDLLYKHTSEMLKQSLKKNFTE